MQDDRGLGVADQEIEDAAADRREGGQLLEAAGLLSPSTCKPPLEA
ncbi:hypothetical protein ACVMDN_000618 [Bradyrhizobium sp. USDA 4510]